jgi:hypothetical protein
MEQPSTAAVTPEPAIYLALELGDGRWKLAFTTGVGCAPRERTIKAGDLTRLQTEIRNAKERFGLPSAASLTSCYEAGRNGFWLHLPRRSATREMPAGRYGFWPAGMRHFAWVQGKTIAELHGTGPWIFANVNPADDSQMRSSNPLRPMKSCE